MVERVEGGNLSRLTPLGAVQTLSVADLAATLEAIAAAVLVELSGQPRMTAGDWSA